MGLFYAGRSANINSYEKKYDIEVNVQFFGHVKQKTWKEVKGKRERNLHGREKQRIEQKSWRTKL
jgi:hypothetical protein